jgi:Spy/CpxP family protein refolding chaperone
MSRFEFRGPNGPNTPRKRVILMRTTRLIALLLVVLLVIAVAAYAQAPMKPKGQKALAAAGDQTAAAMTPEQRKAHAAALASLTRVLMPPGPREFAQFATALNLTDEQKEAIKALYQTFGEAVKATAPGRAEALKGVVATLKQPSPNKSDLQAGAVKVFDADKIISDAEFDFWIGLKGILNAQQQNAAASFMQNRVMGELEGGRRGGPGGPGGPPPQ